MKESSQAESFYVKNLERNGKPDVGWVKSTGVHIRWKGQPTTTLTGWRKESTGATPRQIIGAVVQRLEFQLDKDSGNAKVSEALELLRKAAALMK